MSNRDYGLLDAAGLSIADAAKLFNRSRQAIYTGLSHERDYFSAENAIAILHDARRKDSARIEGLIKFIGANYTEAESKLILPDQVGYDQVSRVVEDADQVVLVFNGNVEHLVPAATFVKVLKNLVAAQRPFVFIIPGEWVTGYMRERLGLHVAAQVAKDDVTYFPSFVVTERQGMFRAFFFMHLSAEEMTPTEAALLWERFASRYSKNSAHKSAEAR